MWSCSRSAFEPSSVTILPFTSTRPPAMSFSALRREAIPAAAIIFCKRSEGMYEKTNRGGGGRPSVWDFQNLYHSGQHRGAPRKTQRTTARASVGREPVLSEAEGCPHPPGGMYALPGRVLLFKSCNIS